MDVAILVDFQHGFEFGVGDDVSRWCEALLGNEIRCAGCPFLHQIEAGDRRTGRGSDRNRRRCNRLGSRREVRPFPFVLPDLAG